MPATSLLRQMKPSEVVCPAGDLVGDASVRCGIEQHTLGTAEAESITRFCTGCYTECSTWIAMKKVEAAGGDLRKIMAGMETQQAKLRAARRLRDARLARAQRLMTEDSPEGRAFRRHLLVGEFDPDA